MAPSRPTWKPRREQLAAFVVAIVCLPLLVLLLRNGALPSTSGADVDDLGIVDVMTATPSPSTSGPPSLAQVAPTPALTPDRTPAPNTSPSPSPFPSGTSPSPSPCISPLCYRWFHTHPECSPKSEAACLAWMTTVSRCGDGNATHPEPDGRVPPAPLSPLHDPTTGTLPFHMYWTGPLPRVAGLSIMSLLATQPRARLVLWANSSDLGALGPEAAWLAAHTDVVEVRKFDPVDEWSAMRYEFPLVRPDLVFPQPTDDRPFRFADLARLMILYRFGGVYTDADMLFLRDLAPLLHLAPFMYGWACRAGLNNAIIAMPARAPEVHTLLTTMLGANVTVVNTHWFYPSNLSAVIVREQVPIRVLSSYLLDPVWIRLDRQEPAGTILGAPCQQFTATSDFFNMDVQQQWAQVARGPGTAGLAGRTVGGTVTLPKACYPAFAVHWHNQWQAKARNGSMASFYESLLAPIYIRTT